MKLLLTVAIFILLLAEVKAQTYLMDVDVNKDTLKPNFGNKRKYNMAMFMGYGLAAGKTVNYPPSEINYGKSFNFRYGTWLRYKVNKYYSLGSSIEYYREEYRLRKPIIGDTFKDYKIKFIKQISNNVGISLFNRFNFSEDYFFLELGGYLTYDFYPKIITKVTSETSDFKTKKSIYLKPNFINPINYGIDLKITFDFLSLYSRYRISGLYKNTNSDLTKLNIGISFDIKN